MAVPKVLLEDLLRAVPYERLRRLAKHYTRMQGVNTPEFYVERMSTVDRVGFVISDLTAEELEPLARLLELDPTATALYLLKKRCITRLELYSKIEAARTAASKGAAPTSQQTFEMVGRREPYKTILTHLLVRREALGETVWTEGEQLARLTLAVAAAGEGRMAVPSDIFLEVVEDWPSPVLASLRRVGATRTADLLEATYAKQFSTIRPDATLDERSTVLRQYQPNFPSEAKEWKRDWTATGESVDSLARAYLVAKPELF